MVQKRNAKLWQASNRLLSSPLCLSKGKMQSWQTLRQLAGFVAGTFKEHLHSSGLNCWLSSLISNMGGWVAYLAWAKTQPLASVMQVCRLARAFRICFSSRALRRPVLHWRQAVLMRKSVALLATLLVCSLAWEVSATQPALVLAVAP